jgi:hypothetical protein
MPRIGQDQSDGDAAGGGLGSARFLALFVRLDIKRDSRQLYAEAKENNKNGRLASGRR